MHGRKRICSGFSLMEVLMVLTLSGWLATAGLALLRVVPVKGRLDAGVHSIVAALNYARSEALRSARPVHVCALHRRRNERLNSCRPRRSRAQPWEQGALVYADTFPGGTGGYDRREDLRDISWPSGLWVESGHDRYRLNGEGVFTSAQPDFRLTDPGSGLCARVWTDPATAAPRFCFGSSCPGGC
jgi:type IV fimbrial biogenesis protein FimT